MLPRSRCAGLTPRDAGHPEPAQSRADGMGAALRRRYPRQDQRTHRILMTDIIVPTEQEGTKAVVKTWLKKGGEALRIDDPVVELETDKGAVEIAATSAGTLSEILIEEGAE